MAEEGVPVTTPAAEPAGTGSSDAEQNRAARPGGEAAGGLVPEDRQADAARADADDAAMRARNFGDHKGASIDRQP